MDKLNLDQVHSLPVVRYACAYLQLGTYTDTSLQFGSCFVFRHQDIHQEL